MKRFIGLSVLAGTFLGVVFLVAGREPPPKNELTKQRLQVAVQELAPRAIRDAIVGHGSVEARWETVLTSEVGGRVLRISDRLLTGSRFTRGELLVEIDATAYEAALASAKAELETARRVLREEEQRAEIAVENWRRSGLPGVPADLARRTPQLREARALREAAAQAVRKAEYDLARTRIHAPYDGAVIERNIQPGGRIEPGNPIARIYDRSVFEVAVPLNQDQMRRLGDSVIGTPARLRGSRCEESWEGVVTRVDQVIDPLNRWRKVVVELRGDAAPLPGEFVAVDLICASVRQLLVLPEHVPGKDGSVWYVDAQDVLRTFPAEVRFRKEGLLYLAVPAGLPSPLRVTPSRDLFLAGTKVEPVVLEAAE